jgi:hypothetical protein
MMKTLLLALFLLPAIANAQTFASAISGFLVYVNQIIPILIALILLAFFWSAANFIRTSGKGGEVEEAKKRLWWGVIALFVAISFWGVVQFLSSDIFGETPIFGPPAIHTDEINGLFPRNDTQNPECINGLDDDDDGLIDFLEDGGCEDANDTTE